MQNEKDRIYFNQLNQTLKKHGRSIPCLLVDLDSVDKNIEQLKQSLKSELDLRIVAKSLPSYNLLNYIMKAMNTERIMVFHQPFLSDISARLSKTADILLGKPMPYKTAAYFYNNLPNFENGFNPYSQIQWLVDTPKRIAQYIELSKELKQKLRLNIELDVGLHRGGFNDLTKLRKSLKAITKNDAHVSFSGFMGYDPHVVKLPKIIRSQKKALALSNAFYRKCKTILKVEFSELWNDQLTFNGAGSPTIYLHQDDDTPLSEVAAGSCFVKPTTFDIDTLKGYAPASYIATPILKKLEGTTIPGIERFKSFLNLISKSNRQSYFIYGGFWKADYCYPKGLKDNKLFGASTNQTMINGPVTADVAVDDHVFLRPHQSEFVFLHFGEILVVRNSEIVDTWMLLKNN